MLVVEPPITWNDDDRLPHDASAIVQMVRQSQNNEKLSASIDYTAALGQLQNHAALAVQKLWRGVRGRRYCRYLAKQRDEEEDEEDAREMDRVVVLKEAEVEWWDDGDENDRAEQDDVEVVEVAWRLHRERQSLRHLRHLYSICSLVAREMNARRQIMAEVRQAACPIASGLLSLYEQQVRCVLAGDAENFQRRARATWLQMEAFVVRSQIIVQQRNEHLSIRELFEGVEGLQAKCDKGHRAVVAAWWHGWTTLAKQECLAAQDVHRNQFTNRAHATFALLHWETEEVKWRTRWSIREFCGRAAVERDIGDVTFGWECARVQRQRMETEMDDRQALEAAEVADRRALCQHAALIAGHLQAFRERLAMEAEETQLRAALNMAADDALVFLELSRDLQREEGAHRAELQSNCAAERAGLPLANCLEMEAVARESGLWGEAIAFFGLTEVHQRAWIGLEQLLGHHRQAQRELEGRHGAEAKALQRRHSELLGLLMLTAEETRARATVTLRIAAQCQTLLERGELAQRWAMERGEQCTIDALVAALLGQGAALEEARARHILRQMEALERDDLQSSIANQFNRLLEAWGQKRLTEVISQEEFLRQGLRQAERGDRAVLERTCRETAAVLEAQHLLDFRVPSSPCRSLEGTLTGTMYSRLSELGDEDSFHDPQRRILDLTMPDAHVRMVATPESPTRVSILKQRKTGQQPFSQEESPGAGRLALDESVANDAVQEQSQTRKKKGRRKKEADAQPLSPDEAGQLPRGKRKLKSRTIPAEEPMEARPPPGSVTSLESPAVPLPGPSQLAGRDWQTRPRPENPPPPLWPTQSPQSTGLGMQCALSPKLVLKSPSLGGHAKGSQGNSVSDEDITSPRPPDQWDALANSRSSLMNSITDEFLQSLRANEGWLSTQSTVASHGSSLRDGPSLLQSSLTQERKQPSPLADRLPMSPPPYDPDCDAFGEASPPSKNSVRPTGTPGSLDESTEDSLTNGPSPARKSFKDLKAHAEDLKSNLNARTKEVTKSKIKELEFFKKEDEGPPGPLPPLRWRAPRRTHQLQPLKRLELEEREAPLGKGALR